MKIKRRLVSLWCSVLSPNCSTNYINFSHIHYTLLGIIYSNAPNHSRDTAAAHTT
jgi:hypothetical protein